MKLKHKTILWLILAIVLLIANFVLVQLLQSKDDWGRWVTIVTLVLLFGISCQIIKAIEWFYIKKLPHEANRHAIQVTGIKALSRLAQVGLLLIFALILLGVLQIPLSGLITVGGVGGLAIAYAGKDTLSNFVGGVMIYINRQFIVGDEISSPDRDIAGVIEDMGWRFTTIRRKNGETMYVPNNIFSNILLVNLSRTK